MIREMKKHVLRILHGKYSRRKTRLMDCPQDSRSMPDTKSPQDLGKKSKDTKYKRVKKQVLRIRAKRGNVQKNKSIEQRLNLSRS